MRGRGSSSPYHFNRPFRSAPRPGWLAGSLATTASTAQIVHVGRGPCRPGVVAVPCRRGMGGARALPGCNWHGSRPDPRPDGPNRACDADGSVAVTNMEQTWRGRDICLDRARRSDSDSTMRDRRRPRWRSTDLPIDQWRWRPAGAAVNAGRARGRVRFPRRHTVTRTLPPYRRLPARGLVVRGRVAMVPNSAACARRPVVRGQRR